MATSGKGQNAQYRTNNHGTWFVSAYSLISIFTKNQTQQAYAKNLIEKFATDSSNLVETYYA